MRPVRPCCSSRYILAATDSLTYARTSCGAALHVWTSVVPHDIPHLGGRFFGASRTLAGFLDASLAIPRIRRASLASSFWAGLLK